MRKILLILFALLFISSGVALAGDGYFNAKLGFDFCGNLENSYSGDYNVDTGLTIAGEYLLSYDTELDYGVGLAYQVARGLEGTKEEVEFGFIPVYGILKYRMDDTYLMGQLGYNFLTGTDDFKYGEDNVLKGGLYYGLGIGYNFSDTVSGELLYSHNNGGIEDGTEVYESAYLGGYTDVDIDNSQVSLMIVYKF